MSSIETHSITRINPIVRFDLAFSHLCVGHKYVRQVGQFSRAVSHTGDGHLYPILAAIAWLIEPVEGRLLLICSLLAFAIELPIYWVTKNIFRRRRPHNLSAKIINLIEPSDRYSLPSGHTAAATIMAVLAGFFFSSLIPFVALWAAMIAMSRILLGVHFFSDIVVGVGLGVFSVFTAISIIGV